MIGNPAPKVAAILLCAGEGSRFKGTSHKLLQPLGSSTVVALSLQAMIDAAFEINIVVDGAIDLGEYLESGVNLVHNKDWNKGMATSLKIGVEAAKDLGVSRIVVGLGDQPGIYSHSWRAVGACEGRPIAVATYHGKRRNPVKLDSVVWDLLPSLGDEGARALMRAYPELVEEVDCDGDPRDIDIVEDLIKWNS